MRFRSVDRLPHLQIPRFPPPGGGVAIFSFGAVALGPLVFIFTVEDAVLLIGLVGYAIWWAYELHRGSKISRLALGMHILIYALLAAYVFSSGVLALSRAGLTPDFLRASWYLVPVGLPFLVSIAVGYRFARRRLVVERSTAGRWTYRGAAAVPFLWLFLWLVRLGLEDGPLRGYSVFTGPWLGVPAPTAVPALTFGVVVSVVVGVYFVSFGFLIGFSVAVWGSFRASRRAFEAELPARGAPAGRPISVEPFSGGSPKWAPHVPPAGSYQTSGALSAGAGLAGRPGVGLTARGGLDPAARNLNAAEVPPDSRAPPRPSPRRSEGRKSS